MEFQVVLDMVCSRWTVPTPRPHRLDLQALEIPLVLAIPSTSYPTRLPARVALKPSDSCPNFRPRPQLRSLQRPRRWPSRCNLIVTNVKYVN